MKNFGALSILLCLAALLPSTVLGETFHRFHLDHNDGLSNNYIRDISQDGHGFVWIATIDGLNRFDGVSFRRFSKENSGLSSNELNSLLADPNDENIIWISTRHDGLCKFDYRTCTISRLESNLRSNNITSLNRASGGKIWVTHYHDIPDLLDPATGIAGGIYESTPDDFPRPVWCAVEDSVRHALYIGHDGKGFSHINLVNKRFENFRPDASRPDAIKGCIVYCIHVDRNGFAWAGTDKGVSIYDPERRKFLNISHDGTDTSLLPGQVRSICEMSNGDIWFGTTEGGISILSAADRAAANFTFFNIKPARNYSVYNNISSPIVMKIMEDSYGNKWIGNNSDAIDVFTHELPFFTVTQPFTSARGVNRKQAVWSIALTTDGRTWLGGDNEVLEAGSYPPKRIKLADANLGYSSQVNAMLGHSDGTLWAGTSYAGIYILDNNRNKTAEIRIPDAEIKTLAEMPDGTVWAGTSLGIFSIDSSHEAVPVQEYNALLPDLYITSILHDSAGTLWVGTLGKGAVRFSPAGDVMQSYDATNGLPSNAVSTIAEDSDGNIWIGTREGAYLISDSGPRQYRCLTQADGLASSFIKSVQEDRNGNVWFSTNRGIALYNPADGKISVYERTHATGLEAYIEQSSALDRNGTIYFGSLNGLTTFSPSSHKVRRPGSDVVLTELVVHDRNSSDHDLEIEIPISGKEITLPYNRNTFSLKFNNPDITGAANSEYSYNMVGVNEVWTKGMHNNVAVYRNLAPGKYRFQVRQRLNGAEWGSPQVLAYITITPPAWLSWWAILIYVLAGSLLIFGLVSFYKHKLNLEKNLAIERENIKNVQSLNEERMIFFTNITHELRTPLSLIIGPIEDLVNDSSIADANRRKLHTIRTSSMRLLNLINGILEFRKTETHHRKLSVVQDSLANFVREVGLRFKELNSNKEVSIVIDVAQLEGVKMYYDPEVITTIINNLMGNAMKYTQRGQITLSLSTLTEKGVKYVDLSVADTGTGISKEALPHIFERYYQAANARKTAGTGIGLALTKNLAELHQGSISVTSEEGKGTVFTVRLLVDNSYPDANHLEAANEPEKSVSTAGHTAIAPDGKLVLLIVEDDADIREYIAQAFSDDFRVVTASNGREGYEAAMAEMPDIIVSDIMMPEMDGIELCDKIKSDASTSHIPVILLTAKDTIRDKEEDYRSGADSYITKPFSATLLRARINNIIETRHKLTMRLLDIPAPHMADDADSDANTPDSSTPAQELSSIDKEFVEKLRRLVEENMEMEEFDQVFLADRMCMSPSTLYRKVKSIAGLNPNEFIRKIKLRKALELLAEGSHSLADIAAMTGFGSAAYFRRLFKKEFGVSPTEYFEKTKRTIS
ncbi:MAG: ATP-binding protein [Muribaculaceae bacterium]|nr:ATP-binding protein [Muribaculaceae bacterium]